MDPQRQGLSQPTSNAGTSPTEPGSEPGWDDPDTFNDLTFGLGSDHDEDLLRLRQTRRLSICTVPATACASRSSTTKEVRPSDSFRGSRRPAS